MKRNYMTITITLITVICFVFSSIAFAAGPSYSGTNGNNWNDSAMVENAINAQNDLENGTNSQNGEENGLSGQNNNTASGNSGEDADKDNPISNTLREQKRMIEQTRDTLREQKAELEEEKAALESQYREAVRMENAGLAQTLKTQIQDVEHQINSLKEQIKQNTEQIREMIRNTYTNEERVRLNQLEEELKEKYKDIVVIPVDSVIAKGKVIKFDTPPVAKEGRTLVPVRAVAEGFGASVTWEKDEKKIIIQREKIRIVLQLWNRLAYVNGEEIEMDVPPETINNRTVVPLRFVFEKLGLKVNWNAESKTIEIEEDQSENADESTGE